MSELGVVPRTDQELIAMWVADPGFKTDERIVQAFNYAVGKGCTHYFPAAGFDEYVLQKAIAQFYEEDRGVRLDPATEVCVTHGAQEGLSFSIHVSLKPGDEMIVLEPTYSALIEKLEIFGVKPTFVPLIESEGWRLDIDSVRSAITDKTKMIFVCNPNNPTGTVCRKEEIDALSNILRENRHLSILLDECYSRILYDGTRFHSLMEHEELLEQVFVVNSFSKAYAMTGWRLGYVITGKKNCGLIKRHAFEYNGSVSYALQYAGATALTQCSSFVRTMVKELDRRRHAMMDGLAEIMDTRHEIPRAGFEVFPDLSSYSGDSVKLSSDLERGAKVRTIPGAKFGPDGEGHLRLVFCSENVQRIREGMKRLKKFLEANSK